MKYIIIGIELALSVPAIPTIIIRKLVSPNPPKAVPIVVFETTAYDK